jgi:hypothetical protein
MNFSHWMMLHGLVVEEAGVGILLDEDLLDCNCNLSLLSELR